MPFGAFVQVGDGIEGLVHISEMSAHHVDLPEQVVTPGEELWVKIIDLDLQRRRISLSIKQAAEGGEVAEEYREHFGEHAYDDEGNYIGPAYDASAIEEAWEQYEQSQGDARAAGRAERRVEAAPEAAADDGRGRPRRADGVADAPAERVRAHAQCRGTSSGVRCLRGIGDGSALPTSRMLRRPMRRTSASDDRSTRGA